MVNCRPSEQSGLTLDLLVVSQYYDPENFIINTVSQRLAALGHRVNVLTGMPNYPTGRLFPGYRGFAPRREAQGRVGVFRVPIIPRGSSAVQLVLNYLSFAVSASVAAFLCRPRADLVLVFQPSPVTVGIPALVVKWLNGARLIFWVQDLWPESLAATGATRSRMIIATVRRLVRFLYRRSDIIGVSSRAFEQPVRSLSPDADVRYLPNPANPEPQEPSDAPHDEQKHLLPAGFRILFAGNFGAAQGLHTVLDAAHRTRHLPHIKWILVGDGRAGPALRSRIEIEKLEDTVFITGPFPQSAMPNLLAQADVLLVALHKDPLFALTVPSKLQTYLAAGKPILAATDGETARIVREAGAGIACPAGDAEALAEATIQMSLLDATARQAMGGAGRTYYAREFALDQIVARIEGWLTELDGSRRCAS
ncbi:glycosyltransferase WbuB [Agaricicola taiwanensis]|uniref:Glycosyltransferase WbuB n=1 Tax=Agaricicola taiwanensis TaxID=591372 RepID=A0A8J2VUA6_9RHOB|nr:glycosyltransferase family 4 protein [Agaricicola taiwanensis]GGE39839.1 glycosyltransferase WbuB [Agaricicola taiwanensis]